MDIRSVYESYQDQALKVTDLKYQLKFWTVHALGYTSFEQKFEIMEHVDNRDFSKDAFIRATCYPTDRSYSSYIRKISLHDAGFLPNDYNFHLSFKTKKKALEYTKVCRGLGIDFRKIDRDSVAPRFMRLSGVLIGPDI